MTTDKQARAERALVDLLTARIAAENSAEGPTCCQCWAPLPGPVARQALARSGRVLCSGCEADADVFKPALTVTGVGQQ